MFGDFVRSLGKQSQFLNNMTDHSVLLLGATGETGREILDGLLEDGNFVWQASLVLYLH